MSNIVNSVESTINGYWYGSSNETDTKVYPTETMAPEACAVYLDPEVAVFWDSVFVMAGLFMITILMPYLCFCCWSRSPGWVARFYNAMALINIVMGALLASVLIPKCPLSCGAFVCDVHKYSPGPIYGCVVIFVGLLWFCKACAVSRQAAQDAKNEDVEKEAARALRDRVDKMNRAADDESTRSRLTVPNIV